METVEGVTHLNVEEAHDQIEKKHTHLIDVRNLDEVEQVAIPGSIRIPLPELSEESLEDHHLGAEHKNEPIVLHCAKGGRCHTAAKMLMSWGYTNVMSLNASLQDWKDAGYTVE